jgi:hypothetical protein
MKRFRPFAVIRDLGLMAAALITPGCSDTGEDVRVTLCKDIVSVRFGTSVAINGADTQIKGYEHAAIKVFFSHQGREGKAVCYYDHKAVDETADLIGNPLNAYATSPYEVTIDGQRLSKPDLAEAIKQAMLKQGKAVLERAKKGIEDAVQR